MDDIVEQAHAYLAANAAESGADVLIAEMADEIARLRAENERLRTALRKIAKDDYDNSDFEIETPFPSMIWQGVALKALGDPTVTNG